MTLDDLSEVFSRELGAAVAVRAMALLRRYASGDRLYISRPRVRPEVRRDDTVDSLMMRYAVSRRTAYYWLGAAKKAARCSGDCPSASGGAGPDG
jgi:hypothetical protein